MRTRWPLVLALGLLAPVGAEYLSAYDESTGDPAALAAGLLVFVPLYGAPALLIREAARRRGLGWPSVLLLATAFGLVQAGLVDQSMWSRDYRGIPYWSDLADPTYVAPIGLSVHLAVAFVGGHVVASIGAPVALVEGLAGRRRLDPWCSRWVLALLVVLYAAASALVMADHYATQDDHASPGQLVATAVAAVLLVGAALSRRWHRPRTVRSGGVPSPWLVALGTAAAYTAGQLYGPSPLGTDALLATAVATAVVVTRLSARAGWGPQHTTAVGAGALVAVAGLGFLSDPLGDVSTVRQLAHNLVLGLLVAATGVLAVRQGGPAEHHARCRSVTA